MDKARHLAGTVVSYRSAYVRIRLMTMNSFLIYFPDIFTVFYFSCPYQDGVLCMPCHVAHQWLLSPYLYWGMPSVQLIRPIDDPDEQLARRINAITTSDPIKIVRFDL